jgi:CheY-like chemotaxis protein
MPSGGKLIIETSTEQLGERNTILNANISPGAYNVLTVTDTGVGMTEEVQDHIFEPFFTTKGVGEGTGLGLSTCYGIVTQSGGHITVDSQPGEGTTFKVFLPRVEEKPTAESRPDEKRSWPTGIETVLLAEDEPLVRSLIVEVLESQGYNVLQASNGAEAMRIAESQTQEPIDLLLTDIVMPLMGGNELANRFRVLRPEAKIIYMSGYPKDLPESGAEFIEKPTSPDILASKVRSVLDSASAPSDSS